MGPERSLTSTKPSGSTRAMLTCSPSVRIPITLLRRFPEALRKFDQILDITPDDVDTLAIKAAIAQAQGDLPRASALLAPLHPNAEDTNALETQVYQAILERHPAQIIPRLKEILAKPDPALGYHQWRTALLVRLGARSRGRSCRRPRKLATSAQRTGIFPQGTAGKLSVSLEISH